MYNDHHLYWNGKGWNIDSPRECRWFYYHINPEILHTHPVNVWKVIRYATMMAKGVKFPPVHVFEGRDGRYWVNNGAHRTMAARFCGIKVFVKTKYRIRKEK